MDNAVPDGRLADNITHFARALRRAGLPLGPGRVIEAAQAMAGIGFSNRQDFHDALHALFVQRPEERAVFDQVFRLFWRDPRFHEQMMSLLLPQIRGLHDDRRPDPAETRAAGALLGDEMRGVPQTDAPPDQIEIDASATASAEERLRHLDFEQMSLAEMAEAKAMLATLRLPVKPLVSRRMQAGAQSARIDARKTLRGALRTGGEVLRLAHKTPRERRPNLVLICDISGSMSQYSRMALQFLHAVANDQTQGWGRVHGFTFGTRLTNITRALAKRDVDAALAMAGAQAQDWSGGTRIAGALRSFNRDWSRRVLGQGAVVVLITDGLDHDRSGQSDADDLAREMQRLHLSARHLIWLNPLLRWQGFAPKAAGIRAMLPHVDAFRSAHSIASLADLGRAIADRHDHGERARSLAMLD